MHPISFSTSFNVFSFFLYLATISVFIFFYYRAVRQNGLIKLKKFTEVMLLVFGGFMIFGRLIPPDMFYKLPVRVLLHLGGADYATYLLLMVMVFFVYTAINIAKEEKPRLLMIAWLAIALLNMGDILLNVYYFNTQTPPATEKSVHFSIDINMEYAALLMYYLLRMIYPACWVIVSCISLRKIQKERQRNVSVETA